MSGHVKRFPKKHLGPQRVKAIYSKHWETKESVQKNLNQLIAEMFRLTTFFMLVVAQAFLKVQNDEF